jgi:hypothetical protein
MPEAWQVGGVVHGGCCAPVTVRASPFRVDRIGGAPRSGMEFDALAGGEIPIAFSGSQREISIASPTHHSDPTAITVVVAIPALGRADRPLVSWKI